MNTVTDTTETRESFARRTFLTVEPYHGIVYFAAEANEAYAALGLDATSGYFASRSAPMGPVPAEVVHATFFNFNPDLVRSAMDGVWQRTTPDAVSAARLAGASAALADTLGDAIDSAEMVEAADLAMVAADAARAQMEGRPLFAGHCALATPERPHERLWHAQMLLREFRGDGHVAALCEAGLSGIEALVLHAARGDVPRAGLQATRGWSDAAWDAATAALAHRGLVTADGAFTGVGRELRHGIEERTDLLAAHPWATLGAEGCQRLRGLVRPWTRTLMESGRLPF